MKTGLAALGTALGALCKPNIEKYPNVDAEFLEKTVGIRHTYHKKQSEDAVDLCVQAFKDLQRQRKIAAAEVRMLAVVSQHTRANIPPLSATLAGKLGLPTDAFCLDLSLGCTGFVQGMSVLIAQMRALNVPQALLFNVETLSEILTNDDPNTNFIFSDAATVALLDSEDVFATPIAYSFATDGKSCLALNAHERFLVMDGLEVYNFVARQVPKALRALIQENQLTPQQIDFVFFHQASLRTVGKLKESFPGVEAPYDILDYGNTGSCSIPFLLKDRREKIRHAKNQRFLLSSFGSGLSYANCLMRSEP